MAWTKLRGQVEQVLGLEVVADQIEVLRGQDPGVLRDLVEVGIEGPLADLVAGERPVLAGDVRAEVAIGARAADAAGTALGELAVGRRLPRRGRRVQMARIFLAKHRDPPREGLVLAAVLVAQRHQAERRMVAVRADRSAGARPR